ncbi:hypothetical protein UFOVP648_11 [uncultured Caudovirales phage]|uniref:Uncharacterized protein n=1 Tax=uncultured Caudovirales phage TaxID=2100421 RepID=A0A6J5N904_9CAUD|nr:hypothetical protein UFOVP648_11 [uncultured Caudovirales phage]
MLNVDEVIKNFATDLLNVILVQLEQPYTSQSGKRFKGLDSSSALYNSMMVSYDSTPTIKVEGLDYLKYFDAGRRAGARKIPVQVILKWIKKKKIRPRNAKGQFKSMTLNQLAFVIQRSIYNIGIRPRNVMKRSFEQIDKLYKDNVESGIQEIIDSLFININDEVGKTSAALFKIKPNTIKAK